MDFFHLMNTEKGAVNILIPFLVCKSRMSNKVAVCGGWHAIAPFFGDSTRLQVHTNSLSPFSMSSGAN